MRALIASLENVDSRLLMMGAVLLCAVGFALFKMTGAFAGEQDAPAYRNQPAQAFVPPSSGSLVEAQYLTTTRLPDEGYITVSATTRKLMGPVARLEVTQAELLAAGMSQENVSSTLQAIRAQRVVLSGRTVSPSGELSIAPGAGDTALVTTSVQYSSAETTDETVDGAPPVSATLRFSYQLRDTTWELDSISVTVEDATTFSGESSTGQGAGQETP